MPLPLVSKDSNVTAPRGGVMGRGLSAMVVMSLAAIGVAGCHKSSAPLPAEPVQSVASPQDVPVPAIVRIEASAEKVAVTEDWKDLMTGSEADQWGQEARRVMRENPDKNAKELLEVPEVQKRLSTAIQGLANDQTLQKMINSTVDLTAAFSGREGPSGSWQLDLDVSNYNEERAERMMTAVMSGKPEPVVQYLVAELGEAAFEFHYTGVDRASNGVALIQRSQAAPASDVGNAPPDD